MVDALAVTKGEPAKYPLLEIKMLTESGETHYHLAVDESAVKRVSHTLEADVYINDQLYENFRGDGLCVSTPTSTTDYGKSLGGAVIHPQLKAIEMTEINSINNLACRSLTC